MALLESRPHMMALFASGYSDDVIAHHGVLDEGIEFINKPYTKQILSERIRQVLDAHLKKK